MYDWSNVLMNINTLRINKCYVARLVPRISALTDWSPEARRSES